MDAPCKEHVVEHQHHMTPENLNLNAIQILTGTPSTPLIRGSVRLFWQSFRETTGLTGATIRLRNGNDASGKFLETITLVANESTREQLGDNGIPFHEGIYYELVSGTIEGVLLVATEANYQNHTNPQPHTNPYTCPQCNASI